MAGITTHVLDTSLGRPASGVPIVLTRRDAEGVWNTTGSGVTDTDGRLRTLLPDDEPFAAGVYRMRFDTGEYFRAQKRECFYPQVVVEFEIADTAQHYHVPLLLSPFGYSTYRGS